jgi:transcriptional regulator with XRE-family HTH domain
MTNWRDVSRRIRERREQLGLTQGALGRAVGSSANYVAQVEGGLAISETKLALYAAALRVSLPYLRYGVAEGPDLEAVRAIERQRGRAAVLDELRLWLAQASAPIEGTVVSVGPIAVPLDAVVDRTAEARAAAEALKAQEEASTHAETPARRKPARRRHNHG